MPYEYRASSANPRLLILLTDELEESVKVVNHIIDQQIQSNFDGYVPKNRYFISVIGYNNNAKELCSGWLKDLDANPLRCETLKKEIPDGTGKFVEVEVKQPVWIECSQDTDVMSFRDAVIMAKDFSKLWIDSHKLLSPIIIDCSEENHVNLAIEEVEELKAVASLDGNTLLFGTYSVQETIPFGMFSIIPNEWLYRLERWGIDEVYYANGLFKREELFKIISAITQTGAEAVL